MGAGVSLGQRRRTALIRDKDFISSPLAKWWDGRERNWIMEAWDILHPLSQGKWWAYSALRELMCDFERCARTIAKTIVTEFCVEQHRRVLKKGPDGKYRAHHMEIVLVPESSEAAWKSLSDELAAVRALWRCRSYYFVPPIMCIYDGFGLRMAFRALPPKGSRVIYGAGAAKLQKQAALQLQAEVQRLAKVLNLKQHLAFPTIETPSLQNESRSAENVEGDVVGSSTGIEAVTSVSKQRENGGFSIFGPKDKCFETIFGHQVVICAAASGVRFIEMVSGAFPMETGPDLDRVNAELAAKKKKKQEAAAKEALKELTKKLEREERKENAEDNDEGETSLMGRFREGLRSLLGKKKIDYNQLSLHQLQYKCRELDLKFTGNRFELIARIQSELVRLDAIRKEEEEWEYRKAERKKRVEEQKRKEKERLEGDQALRPGFALTGLRRPLRPEFLRQYAKPLNANGHCPWEAAIVSHKSDRIDLEKATEHYMLVKIPCLAMDFEESFKHFPGRKISGQEFSCETLRRVCHEHGIRARDFGKLYNATRLEANRRVILTEMVFRLFKCMLRTVMLEALRACRGLSQQPVLDAVCHFLRLAFGVGHESERFWDGVQEKLEQRFPGFKNLTHTQVSDLEEWEKVAEVVQNFDIRAELERYNNKLGHPDGKLTALERERYDLIDNTLRDASLRERQLRAAIDGAFEHVELQCDKHHILSRLLLACGICLNHGADATQVMQDCQEGIFVPTDIKKIVLVSHTISVGEFAGAIQTVLRATREIENRRVKDIRLAYRTLHGQLRLNPDDWLLCAFYADCQLILADMDVVAERYERLHEAYRYYCKSVRLNREYMMAIYEAGNVMYRMLALRFDKDLESDYLQQCQDYELAQKSPEEWNSHLRKWAALTWKFALESKGGRMHHRAEVAGRLLSLWIVSQREQHPELYKALLLSTLDGLQATDVFAVLEAGKKYLEIDSILLRQSPASTPSAKYSISSAIGSIFSKPESIKSAVVTDGILDLERTPFISEEGIFTLIELLASIEVFRCSKCTNLSAGALDELAERCANTLASFHLNETTNVTSEAIENLCAKCTGIIDFSVKWIELVMTSTLVENISVNWTFVTSLDISRNRKIEDRAIRAIAKHCPHLLTLDLSGLPRISDLGMAHVPRHCLKIRELKLAGCRQISGRSLSEFALRTHALWDPEHHRWRQADGGQVVPFRDRLHIYHDIRHRAMLEKTEDKKTVKETIEEETDNEEGWIEGKCDPNDEWVDFNAALHLQAALEDKDDVEDCSKEWIYQMFDELDKAPRWKVDGYGCKPHHIRLERARRWLLNGVDTEVINIDFKAREKDYPALFETFGSHPPGKPISGVAKTMTMEDILKVLLFLNVCPAYISAVEVALMVDNAMQKKKEKHEGEVGQGMGPHDYKRLDFEDFDIVIKKIAKTLHITKINLSKITRKWIHQKPVPMKSLCARLHPKGEKFTTRCRDVKRKSNDDLQIHLSVGALKIAKDTMEVLNQKGHEFTSIQLTVSTSWGVDYKSKCFTAYSRELHQKQLKESVFKQVVWLFATNEEFVIPIPKKAIVDDNDWKSSNVVISAEFFYFDYVRAARQGQSSGYQSQRVASLTLMMPDNVETDGPVEWLAFAQFMGQPDRILLTTDKRAVTESPKMPPQLRMRYRIIRRSEIARVKNAIKVFHHYEMSHSVGEKAWQLIQRFVPGYLSTKIDALADDVLTQVIELIMLDCINMCIDSLFSGTEGMEYLDLSGCDIDDDCVEELMLAFAGSLRTLKLSDCPCVRPNTVANWVEQLAGLTELDVSMTKDLTDAEAFHDFISCCPHLVSVDFTKCPGLTDGALLHVPACTPSLTNMNLRGCRNFTDTGFLFLKDATALTSLKIAGCIQLSDRAFSATITRLVNLTKIDVSNLSLLNDSCVQCLMTKCPVLRSINLFNNMLLTSHSLHILAEHGHGLQSLNIGANANFDDLSLERFLIQAESLVKLKLRGCVSLTDAVLPKIADHGASLELLDVCNTSTTTSGLRILHRRMPGVHIEHDNKEFVVELDMNKHLKKTQDLKVKGAISDGMKVAAANSKDEQEEGSEEMISRYSEEEEEVADHFNRQS
jgi:hypothetical protein